MKVAAAAALAPPAVGWSGEKRQHGRVDEAESEDEEQEHRRGARKARQIGERELVRLDASASCHERQSEGHQRDQHRASREGLSVLGPKDRDGERPDHEARRHACAVDA